MHTDTPKPTPIEDDPERPDSLDALDPDYSPLRHVDRRTAKKLTGTIDAIARGLKQTANRADIYARQIRKIADDAGLDDDHDLRAAAERWEELAAAWRRLADRGV